MALIPFGEWMPDAAPLGNPGSPWLKNAVPGLNSYKPFKSLAVVSANALDDYPRGAIGARDKDNAFHQYVGDEAKLYRLATATWTDSSKGGGYSTGASERWELIPWRNQVLATNFSDSPQYIDLGGTQFADLTTAFRCRHIAVIKDHVIAANTYDGTDGNVPHRVRNSAFNDATDWTVSSVTGANVRDLNVGGWIQAVVGGEYGIIVSERSTFRMSWLGAPTWFQVDEVLPGVGTIAPGSVVKLADTVYFLSENGFVALVDSSGVAYPGAGKVDQYVRADIDEANLHRVSSAADPKSGRVAWAYPGAGNVGGTPNRIVLFDRVLNKWALIEISVELIWRAGGIQQTLDSLSGVSIDDIESSLDSSEWIGGAPQFAAFNTSYQHGTFTGASMAAVLETKEVELHKGFKALLNGFRPIVDGGTVTARVGSRNRQVDPVTYTDPLSLRSSGRFSSRVRSRYHRFELTLSGDDWTDAIGVEVDRQDARRAGMR